ncbi:metabolite traffic protein EboE [Amycolatopsis nigrescens]|uniref:metabolite traffic protein EboE n=1 Tax=Amycolatopsis nigrescens TaxID=381445 RepID=UPI00037C39C7|nr:metabolite traffic protein EboE [Amycolatopsis nigrescens]
MLSYCTNVHPAEDLDGILHQLDAYALPVRERFGEDRLGLGLWLAAEVAAGLAGDPVARRRLRHELGARGLAVQTLNAFPYRGFHDEVVKHAVYHPQWSDVRRLRYTLDCVEVLADLMPDDAGFGSISTLPLGWRQPWSAEQDLRAVSALDAVTRVLARCDRPVKLAVEPEPGCVLDTVADAVGWLAGRVDPEYIGLCLDTCHLAVSFADPAAAVAEIYDAGLQVMKVQVSAALEVADPASPAAVAALAGFAEPRYLHQVRALAADGRVHASDDLPQASAELPSEGPWRVHFHVPLHASPAEPLGATTGVITDAVAALSARVADPARFPHLEVETYTWTVLPEEHRQDLADGIAEELRWARARLTPEGARI